jgi:hypothetical protein
VKNTVLIVVVVAAIGVGVYLYSRKASAGGRASSDFVEPPPDGVPDRVGQKRRVGSAVASTSSAYRPELPPELQSAVDRTTIAVKRGQDLVSQGRETIDAAGRGDVYGTLVGGAQAYAGATSLLGEFGTGGRRGSKSDGMPYGGGGKPASAGPAQGVTIIKPAVAAGKKPTFIPGLAPTQAQTAEIATHAQARSGKNRF